MKDEIPVSCFSSLAWARWLYIYKLGKVFKFKDSIFNNYKNIN